MDTLMANLWRVLGVVVLVLLNGFFVAAELALVRLRDTQLESLVLAGNRRARIARDLIRNLDRTISASQLGVTCASMGLGVLVEPVFEALLAPLFGTLRIESHVVRHAVALGTGFLVNSFLLTVVGELAPKAMAIRQTLAVALWTAPPLAWFARITYPFVWLLHHSAQWLLARLGIAPVTGEERGHSEEELRLLLNATQGRSGATRFGRELVLNALDLQRRVAREVMRPRQEIVALDTTATIAACLELAEKTRFSRFPLAVGGDLDRTLGVVHFKDLVSQRSRARTGADLLPAARKLIYVPETARLEKLLQLFLDRKLHFAIVVDEYGGTVGMVTLENILEEVVGQIQDEFDQEQPLLVKTGEDSWEINGSLPLHELAEMVGLPLYEEGITTVSGWVTHQLGGFPKKGDRLVLGAHDLLVAELDGMRVASLVLTRRPEETPGDSPSI